MNNGKLIDMVDVLKNKELCAKGFSEGNAKLEKILFFCFNNNIETTSCCIGNNFNPAFVIFKVKRDNFRAYATLFKKMKSNKNISIDIGGIFSEYTNMSIMNYNYNDIDDFFDNIYNVLYNNIKKDDDELFTAMIKLADTYRTANDLIGISYRKRNNITLSVATNSKLDKDNVYQKSLKKLLIDQGYTDDGVHYCFRKQYTSEKNIINDLSDITKKMIGNNLKVK